MPRRSAALAVATSLVAACGVVTSRFPTDVASALRDHDMRRLETGKLIVYYPASRADEARRIATRLDACAHAVRLRAKVHHGGSDQQLRIAMPELPFNNAFVLPQSPGAEDISVVPTHNTVDFSTEFGLPPDPGYIGCHEVVHYVHGLQITGLWHGIDTVFGAVLTPQAGLPSWFWEGLAVWYESQLPHNPTVAAGVTGRVGRRDWPVFDGMFAAGYAGHTMHGGDLDANNRKAPPGHNYLVGSHFIRFLAEMYGEEALWKLVAAQSSAIIYPFSLNSRFSSVYGRSLSELIDEFDGWVHARYPARPRPAGQAQRGGGGSDARYARALNGTEATISEELDAPTRLDVRGPDGRALASLTLAEVVPPRTLAIADPLLTGGLSLTTDGGQVWFTAVDLATTYQTVRLLRYDVARGKLDEIASDLGPGGSIDPAGKVFYYMAVDGDRWNLAALDVATGARRRVLDVEPGQYVITARPSRDGSMLVASVWDGRGWAVWTINPATGAHAALPLAVDAAFDASFADDGRVVLTGAVDGRAQVLVYDPATGAATPVSDAPYAALNPRAAGGTVRFLDREGWRWELAEVALPAAQPPAPPPPTEPAPADPADPAAPTAPAISVAVPAATAPAPIAAAPIAAPPSASPPAPATILSDRPYSAFDGLFRPQLHSFALVAPAAGSNLVGAAISGGDHLGYQRWALAGYLQLDRDGFHTDLLSGSAGYINSMLAPVLLSASASQLDWTERLANDTSTTDDDPVISRRLRDASIAIQRTFRETITVGASGVAVADREEALDPAGAVDQRRLAGAGLQLEYGAGVGTRYGGTQRALVAAAGATYYPDRWSTLGELTDVRGELNLYVPLPIGRRHRLVLRARGRDLVGADDGSGLLQVGGGGAFANLYRVSTVDGDAPDFPDVGLPGQLIFFEDLRGYEDLGLGFEQVAIGDATWRYPVILDYGWASSLYFCPAIFVRELDVDVFGAAAADRADADHLHAAAGGAVSLSIVMWNLPLIGQYQVAHRFEDDEATVQLINLGVGL